MKQIPLPAILVIVTAALVAGCATHASTAKATPLAFRDGTVQVRQMSANDMTLIKAKLAEADAAAAEFHARAKRLD